MKIELQEQNEIPMHVITEYKQQLGKLLLTQVTIIMRLFETDEVSSHA